MDFARIIVPAAPVRRKSRHQSEMTNQLLFGETVRIIKKKKEIWYKVESLHDRYEGWLTAHMLGAISENEAKAKTVHIVTDHNSIIRIQGNPMRLPLGATLPLFDGKGGNTGTATYEYEGAFEKRGEIAIDDSRIRQVAFQWLNTPYQWGGRSIFGIDCSGFVQTTYKQLGIDLPRDAWQQAQVGKTVDKLKDAVCGDLAFFDDKDEIVHVGLLLDNGHIIHASGRVRIDKIDKKGIINTDTGKRTHSLRVIKKLR